MKFYVFIDTSLSGVSLGFVSVSSLHKIVWSGFQHKKGDADSGICQMLDQGLNHLGASNRDIEMIVVSHGPGSFTGIKVGLAWAYGFQSTREQDLLLGVSSLEEGNNEIEREYNYSKTAVAFPISRREFFLSWKSENQAFFKTMSVFDPSAAADLQKLASVGYRYFLISPEAKTVEWFQDLNIQYEILPIDRFLPIALQGMVHKVAGLDVGNLKKRLLTPQYMKKTTVEEKLEIGH